MEQKEEKPSEDGTTVSPTPGTSGTPGGDTSAGEEAKGTSTATEGPPDGAGKQERAPAEGGASADFQGEANGLDEVKVESKVEAELPKEDSGKEETKKAPQEMTGGKEETNSEPKEAEGKEGTVLATEKQKAEEKAATPESREKADVEDQAKAELKQGAGEQEAGAGSREADGEQEATTASLEESAETEEPKAEAQAKASAPEATSDSEKKAALEDEAQAEPQDSDLREEVESGGPNAEQDQGAEKESEEGAGVSPSSPEEWPESPTEEGQGLSPEGLGPDTTASGETSPSASESSPSEVPQSPTEPPPSQEKKKEKAPERRVTAPARPRGARAQNRKAIVDKFGGAASGPTALFRNTKAAGTAIGSVKNMLLEWCRAMTRNYEHVDIQNFSSSWSSGMAFCALIHKFFPDAFDYAELDPSKRRHNFTLAFSTAEKLADCAQLLEVDDMVRLAVPDSKCVYTYIQELYRCLVQKGLVKTKKK
ncbi:smoothelin-like protein 1 [Eptesicus fuscus]|uniref:smoothelin-like protein 1 n=1 Tax=Eptesicus fuscus TaxID=29078 RepID=UPI002403D1C3|nr:smoothelin-like protein 1 [Eptesicus fuscus]XP_027991978.2 smoothelin-like protein 1 [Eptesicus fuscus]